MQKSWYKKWWGIVIIVILFLIFAVVAFFGYFTIKYWKQIRSGQGNTLQKQFYNTASSALSANSSLNEQKRKELETSDDPYLGNPAAEIVIVEFVDFQCPFCKQETATMKKVLQNYGHKVKWIIRDFPIESIHPGATELSQIAYCAQKQNKFWLMHDALFTNQDNLPAKINDSWLNSLSNLADTDFATLKTCYNSDEAKVEVNKDYADAIKYGAIGTPTYFINGQKVAGVSPYKSWEAFLK